VELYLRSPSTSSWDGAYLSTGTSFYLYLTSVRKLLDTALYAHFQAIFLIENAFYELHIDAVSVRSFFYFCIDLVHLESSHFVIESMYSLELIVCLRHHYLSTDF
jgi:hypothetical protein